MIGFTRYFTVVACCVYPPGRPDRSRDLPVAQSRVRPLPGGSPTGLAESSSLTLRTGHSPQVAPHPSSRKRNYHFWIQAGNDILMGTCTPLFKRLHRRTGTALRAVIGGQALVEYLLKRPVRTSRSGVPHYLRVRGKESSLLIEE